ncbi:MAG: twin-arginine translocase subunit TatC [Rhodospirillaceae bacterium]|nr:twin-arginine translocase subunit TatC [Rhodospirillaceae bacterium]|tara:strand:- start:3007 stop:3813 length:807 start_codon:yes stop_codon:yes gene_type:complete
MFTKSSNKPESNSEDQNIQEDGMTLLSHLIELRRRLLICAGALIILFFMSIPVAPYVYGFLMEPLNEVLKDRQNARMIFTGLPEQFLTEIKIAFFLALSICVPILLVQIWKFLAPGLYKNEKRAFLPFLIATPLLFVIGAALVYYFILPMAWKFFIGFEMPATLDTLAIELEPKVNEYLSLVLLLMFAFGIGFQLPVLLILLAKVGIVSSDSLVDKRRYAIVGVFIFSAVITPPDVVSQIGLAIPLIILYEVSIFSAKILEKNKNTKE